MRSDLFRILLRIAYQSGEEKSVRNPIKKPCKSDMLSGVALSVLFLVLSGSFTVILLELLCEIRIIPKSH